MREVYLEAYFEVQRDVDRPFIVHSGEQKVTVLGTSFGISCYASEVMIHDAGFRKSKSILSGESKVRVRTGMQVVYNKESGVATEKKADVAEFVAWKNGKYVFKQKRLRIFYPPV